jgi:hypothetical protein
MEEILITYGIYAIYSKIKWMSILYKEGDKCFRIGKDI